MKMIPEHSYTTGIRLNIKISPWARFFAVPAWTWKSRFWLDDNNTPGMDQQSYGLLNATAGFDFPGIGISLSCTGSNLMDEQYVMYAGHPGNILPVTLAMPGPPKMISGKVTWRF